MRQADNTNKGLKTTFSWRCLYLIKNIITMLIVAEILFMSGCGQINSDNSSGSLGETISIAPTHSNKDDLPSNGDISQQLTTEAANDTFIEIEVSQAVQLNRFVERVCEYNNDGTINSDTSFFLDNDDLVKEERRIEYIYNDSGLLLVSKVYYYGEQSGEELDRYEYDDSGKVLKHFHYGALAHEYQYDDDGHCIKKRVIDSDGVSIYTYTYREGNLATSYEEIATTIEVDDTSVPIYEYYYTEYDDAGRVLKETVFEANESPYTDVYQYTNDSVVVTSYDLSGNELAVFKAQYDCNNRVIYKECLYPASDYSWSNRYDYTDYSETYYHYDSNGSLVRSYYRMWDAQNKLLLEENRDANGNASSSWKYEYDEYGQVCRITQTIGDEITIHYGPEREYFADGSIERFVLYSDVDYIAEIYYISPPEGYNE